MNFPGDKCTCSQRTRLTRDTIKSFLRAFRYMNDIRSICFHINNICSIDGEGGKKFGTSDIIIPVKYAKAWLKKKAEIGNLLAFIHTMFLYQFSIRAGARFSLKLSMQSLALKKLFFLPWINKRCQSIKYEESIRFEWFFSSNSRHYKWVCDKNLGKEGWKSEKSFRKVRKVFEGS